MMKSELKGKRYKRKMIDKWLRRAEKLLRGTWWSSVAQMTFGWLSFYDMK